MFWLDASVALGRVPNSMRARSFTNSAGRATPTAALNRKLGSLQHSKYSPLTQRLHTSTQTSAQLRESNEPIASTAAALTGDEDLLQAAADALDPERTSATLGYTWLTHWQLIEEDRRFRQLVFQSIRGRQQQRQQQLFDLLGVEGTSTSSSDEVEARGAYRQDAEVRIVHGRLSVVSGIEEEKPQSHSSSSSLSSSAAAGERSDLQQQPVNRTSNGDDGEIDDLTWLASHPEAEATEFSLNFENEATTAATGTITSGSSSGGNGMRSTTWPLPTTKNDSTTNKNEYPTQSQDEADSAAAAAVLPGAVQLQLGGDVATVRPLWISIYLEESTGTAKLFESVVPLQSEILDKMSNDLTPFCSVSGLEFGALADLRYGPWLNYFVGLVGEVAVEEADILWPNQVLHRDRVLYNVRGAGDVAKFLADPRKEDVEAHAENLNRLAEERGYRRGWVWYMLRSRWGQGVLKSIGMDPAKT